MTPFETAVAEEYQKQGWSLITSGWPDFILWRKKDGETQIKFVEVKSDNDEFRGNQKLVLTLLRDAGLVVRTAHQGYGYGQNYGQKPYPFFELLVYDHASEAELFPTIYPPERLKKESAYAS